MKDLSSTVAITLLLALVFPAGMALAAEYEIDPVHSSVIYRIKHLDVAYSHGAFTALSGSLVFDPENLEDASIEITVAADSVSSFHPERDKHLKSPDFFNAGEYPEITFKSKAWKAIKENHYEVTGDFTLLGVTKEIALNVEWTGKGQGRQGENLVGFETVFTILRSDYGMTQFLPDMIGDEVRLTIAIEAIGK